MTTAKKSRRKRVLPPGAVWRIQAWLHERSTRGVMRESTRPPLTCNSDGKHVEMRAPQLIPYDHHNQPVADLSGTVIFDELVVGDWLHVEQMDKRQWWMAVGGLRLGISIGRDGVARVCITEDDRTPREKRGNKVEGA
jgi:hypothetical protein